MTGFILGVVVGALFGMMIPPALILMAYFREGHKGSGG
jgi:hypothetical protein